MKMIKEIKSIYTKIDQLLEGEAPAHDQQCEFSDGYFTGLSAALNIIDDFFDSLPEESPNEEGTRMKPKTAAAKVVGTDTSGKAILLTEEPLEIRGGVKILFDCDE